MSLGKGGLLLNALYDKKTAGTVSQRNWEREVSLEWWTDFPYMVIGTLLQINLRKVVVFLFSNYNLINFSFILKDKALDIIYKSVFFFKNNFEIVLFVCHFKVINLCLFGDVLIWTNIVKNGLVWNTFTILPLEITHMKKKYLSFLQIISMLRGEPNIIQEQGQSQDNLCLPMENHLEN